MAAVQPADAPPLIAIVGPTASGKTAWSLAIAAALDGEIISADSRQVYRQLDLGTAKPTPAERARIPHHCLDHVDPRERYHLARFLREARAALAEIHARAHRPILVGGTGQYVWALLEGWEVPEIPPDESLRAALTERAAREGPATLHAELAAIDPPAAARILPGNLRRLIRALEVYRASGRPISAWQAIRHPLPAIIFAPRIEAEALLARIDARVERMFEAGLVEETEALLAGGLPQDAPGFAAIGYREVIRHLAGDLTRAEAVAEVQRASHRFARRQRAWFRPQDPRIRWCADAAQALALAVN